MRRRMLNWLLVAFVTVLCLLLFEGTMRLAGFVPGPHISLRPDPRSANENWAAPDAELGWVNKHGTAQSTEPGNALMTFFADGSRAAPLFDSKKTAQFRVVLVGDSFTQGYAVGDDETYFHFLNLRFPPIFFESFGTGGYNTIQATAMAERVLTRRQAEGVRPILVIYGLIHDHLLRNVGKYRESLTDSLGRHSLSPPHARRRGSELEIHPYREREPWPLERRSVILSLLRKAWIRHGPGAADEAEAAFVTRELLERFARTVRAHGSVPLVVVLEWPRDQAQMIQADSVEVLDCTHPGWGTDPSLRTGDTIGHPTAILHEHYAACIGDWIEGQQEPLVN